MTVPCSINNYYFLVFCIPLYCQIKLRHYFWKNKYLSHISNISLWFHISNRCDHHQMIIYKINYVIIQYAFGLSMLNVNKYHTIISTYLWRNESKRTLATWRCNPSSYHIVWIYYVDKLGSVIISLMRQHVRWNKFICKH